MHDSLHFMAKTASRTAVAESLKITLFSGLHAIRKPIAVKHPPWATAAEIFRRRNVNHIKKIPQMPKSC
jgi:hypothetical protein